MLLSRIIGRVVSAVFGALEPILEIKGQDVWSSTVWILTILLKIFFLQVPQLMEARY